MSAWHHARPTDIPCASCPCDRQPVRWSRQPEGNDSAESVLLEVCKADTVRLQYDEPID